MECVHMFKVIFVLFVQFYNLTWAEETHRYPFLMPNVIPNKPELYLCTPIKIWPTNVNYYIVGFEPNATMDTAHHMLLYGCTKPGSNNLVWNCGEMARNDPTLETHSPCAEGSHVIYAWARDAPMLTLPRDVGFQVGQDSAIKYLVLQVHYASVDKFLDGKTTDNSGIFLHYTDIPRKKLAGVLLLGTGGSIPPHSKTYMESDCEIREDKTIYPFAYRTHTHSLGKVVSGYTVRRDNNGLDHWTLLGKRNPLTPQMFYPVQSTDPIKYGDKLAARCTMVSHRDSYTYIGATNKDEMCNFYLMYYVDEGTPLEMKYCFTQGPPNFSWKISNDVNNIPDIEASQL